MITSPSCAWRGQFGYHFRCLKSAHTFSLVGAYPAHTWTPFCGHRPHIFASKPTIQLHSKPAKPGSPNQPQGASQPASQPGSIQQAGQQARTRRPLSNFKPLDAATPVIFYCFSLIFCVHRTIVESIGLCTAFKIHCFILRKLEFASK